MIPNLLFSRSLQTLWRWLRRPQRRSCFHADSGGRRRLFERQRNNFVNRFDQVDGHYVANFFGHFGQILLVVLWQDNRVDSKAMRSQKGRSSILIVSVPPPGIARKALSQRFQKTCLMRFTSTRARMVPWANRRSIRFLP